MINDSGREGFGRGLQRHEGWNGRELPRCCSKAGGREGGEPRYASCRRRVWRARGEDAVASSEAPRPQVPARAGRGCASRTGRPRTRTLQRGRGGGGRREPGTAVRGSRGPPILQDAAPSSSREGTGSAGGSPGSRERADGVCLFPGHITKLRFPDLLH